MQQRHKALIGLYYYLIITAADLFYF